MQILSERDVLDRISRREAFEGCLNGSLRIKVQDYIPFVATAIHAGHTLSSELAKKCALSSQARRYEEDPWTDELVKSFPITLASVDSRYAYDLNRAPEQCIYETAWNQQVWHRPLTAKQKQASLAKHACYYRVLKALLTAINQIHGSSLLLDIHSYNIMRQSQVDEEQGDRPVFNIGTWRMNLSRWQTTIDAFEQKLRQVVLPNLDTTVAINGVFEGRGYQAAFCRKYVRNTLVIPLEISKIFMDETTGDVYPLVLESLRDQLYDASRYVMERFAHHEKLNVHGHDLTRHELEPLVLKVDRKLFQMARNLETLGYVNPVNLASEKRRFFASKKPYEPEFRYRQLKIDPYEYREKLYRLPVSEIQDSTVRQLYRDVVESFVRKVDLLTSLGSDKFLYSSLMYYGQPTATDLANAQFLLHAPEIDLDANLLESVSVQDAVPLFEQALAERGLKVKVVVSKSIVAKAMVDGLRKQLLLNHTAQLTRMDIQALIHHEIDVHLYTTFNAQQQPLKVLSLGLPGNTHTQEGLAIFNEYMTGCLSVKRLQTLALRVIAVDMRVKGHAFSEIYACLHEQHGLDSHAAFALAMRVTRGGGFTKDYLYLRGLKDVLAFSQCHNLDALFVGKTSLDYYQGLSDLITRGILPAPSYVPDFVRPQPAHGVLDYLLSALK